MDLVERDRLCRDYMEALEEERRKILVFQRELPLCLQIVNQQIESCRMLMGGEDASSVGRPVLEEFIPLKPTLSSSSSEESRRDKSTTVVATLKEEATPDWLRSVQLGMDRDPPQKPVAVNARKFGGAFHPFEKEKLVPVPASSSTTKTQGDWEEEKEEDKSQSNRKSRRTWSPELHRRFLHALEQLGGSHVATPKQIRELMQVDGLTNDEVKSHLQKYRLHTRRPNPTIQSSSSSSPQAPQFVVVGSIWVPPPEYAAAAAVAQPKERAGTPLNGIYAPVASKPPLELRSQQQQSKQSPTGPLNYEGRCSQDNSSFACDGATNSASPTSSSSQTITA